VRGDGGRAAQTNNGGSGVLLSSWWLLLRYLVFADESVVSSFFDFGHWRRVGVRDFGVREEKGRSEREGLGKGGILISFVPISSGSTA
jgi:hypothetical protein